MRLRPMKFGGVPCFPRAHLGTQTVEESAVAKVSSIKTWTLARLNLDHLGNLMWKLHRFVVQNLKSQRPAVVTTSRFLPGNLKG